jgi:F-type H+-transporting ATPase subunit alpha
MKKVAGRLRMELANYRELEAFAKFGSDLDKATQQALRRGSRLVELLKQGQYVPMPVEKQVISLFLGTNGYLDEVAIEKLQRFEREFIELMDARYPELLQAIAESKDIVKEVEEKLHVIAKDFLQKFNSSAE